MLQIRKFFSILRKVSKKRPLQNSLTKMIHKNRSPKKAETLLSRADFPCLF